MTFLSRHTKCCGNQSIKVMYYRRGNRSYEVGERLQIKNWRHLLLWVDSWWKNCV